MTTRSATKTSTRRDAQLEQLHQQLADQVGALARSEQWAAFLRYAAAFHSYSLNNVLLIAAQRPGATRVAGFRKWQSLGRQVRRGEESIKILGYSPRRITTEDDQGDETTRVIPRFPVLSVFDISQTDPIPGHPTPLEPVELLSGDDQHDLVDQVVRWLHTRGWSMTRSLIPGPANGYTTLDGSRTVVVDSSLEPAQAAKTALHEAAHVLLHTDADGRGGILEHRGAIETEAESVAYIVAAALGLDTTPYSVGYITSWSAGDVDLIRTTAARVLAGARTLLDELAGAAAPVPLA